MDTPTPAQVRARSALLAERYPEPDPPADESATFVAAIEDSAAVVGSLTGRLIEPLTEGEEVPQGLVGIAVRATARMAELMDSEGSADAADSTARGERLRGFSAGPYSEQYFAPGDLVLKDGRPQFSPDPTLDRLLWALATELAIEELLALVRGQHAPAGAVSEFDYRKMGGGYFGRSRGVSGGPDGF